MKRIPSPLLALLQNPAAIGFKQDLFFLQLANGTTLAATDGTSDIAVTGLNFHGTTLAAGTTVFAAATFGNWSRSTITTKIGLESNSCTLTVSADGTRQFPGGSGLSILAAAQAGLFAGAKVFVFTAYGTTYGDTSRGLECKFVGLMGEVSNTGRITAEFNVNDLPYLLNVQMPRNLITAQCRHVFGDAACTLDLTTVREFHIVAAGSSNLLINLNSLTGIPRVEQGRIEWTSGNNTGLRSAVRAKVTTTQIALAVPTVFPPQVGDGFWLVPGCDHTLATCNAYQGANALLNFGGQPFVPSPETVL